MLANVHGHGHAMFVSMLNEYMFHDMQHAMYYVVKIGFNDLPFRQAFTKSFRSSLLYFLQHSLLVEVIHGQAPQGRIELRRQRTSMPDCSQTISSHGWQTLLANSVGNAAAGTADKEKKPVLPIRY